MIDEQEPTPEYIKAFNNGYIMQQYDAELLEKIFKDNHKTEQLKAMKAGSEQYEREQFLKEIKDSKDINKQKGLQK